MTDFFADRRQAVGYLRAITMMLTWSTAGLLLIGWDYPAAGLICLLVVGYLVISMRWRTRGVIRHNPSLVDADTPLARNMAQNDLRLRLLFGSGIEEALTKSGLPVQRYRYAIRALVVVDVAAFIFFVTWFFTS